MAINTNKRKDPYGGERLESELKRQMHKELLTKQRNGKLLGDDGEAYDNFNTYCEVQYQTTKSNFASMEKELKECGNSFSKEVKKNTDFANEWLDDDFIGKELRDKYKR